MNALAISTTLGFPLKAVTETFAVLGIRGSGKTHTATVFVEEILKAGQPACVYDPTGAWSGIKTSADGKKPGFPVVIFGGERADVPLEVNAGETIANVIVSKRLPAILDCSLMRKGDRTKFMTDFCETLYRKNRQPLHFVCDEAHTLAPMKPYPNQTQLLGAMEDIVLQGRLRGLGLTVISQRPALLHTNIRTQCGTLVAMRIIGKHDLDAVREWTNAHGTPEQAAELMKSLPTLKTGEGWVWSPFFLKTLERVHFRQRETFDSGATPEVGKRVVTPKAFAQVDIAALGEEVRATVEKAKADDPKTLRIEMSKLTSELAKLKATPAKPATQQVSDRYDEGYKAGYAAARKAMVTESRKLLAEAEDAMKRLVERAVPGLQGAIDKQATFVNKWLEASAPETLAHRPMTAPEIRERIEEIKNPTPQKATPDDPAVNGDEGPLTAPQQKILDRALIIRTRGIATNRKRLARWVGVHYETGSYKVNLGRLRREGYMEGNELTTKGRHQAEQQTTGYEAALAGLPDNPKRTMLRAIAEHGPFDRKTLAAHLDVHYETGSYKVNLGHLRMLGFVPDKGPIVALPEVYR